MRDDPDDEDQADGFQPAGWNSVDQAAFRWQQEEDNPTEQGNDPRSDASL